VSVLTKKSQAPEVSGLRGYAAQAANQLTPIANKAGPVAQQAAPLARNASATFKQGANTAVTRATPLVNAARSWAAPQLEQSARAISETIAPMIADTLLSTARKIDVPPEKPRRGPRVLVASGLLALAASAATAALAILRRRNGAPGYSSISAVDDGGPTLRPGSATNAQPGSASGTIDTGYRGDGSKPDSEADGTPRS
jgi:hypothetical protein